MNSRSTLFVCSTCGRKREKLNSTNWLRHTEKCKNKKIKICYKPEGTNCNITNYFMPFSKKSTTSTSNYYFI